MLKWLRKKVFNIDGTIDEFAREMLNIFEIIKRTYPEFSTDEQYLYTVTTFLEKHYVGTADIETAARMIMSGVSEAAESQNKDLNLQAVVTGAIISYIGACQNKPLSDFSSTVTLASVCQIIPNHL